MNEFSLSDFLREYLDWHLAGNLEAQDAIYADDLASALERNGYCSDPAIEYAKTLCCPINKRREKQCPVASCKSHEFCCALRKGGYIT